MDAVSQTNTPQSTKKSAQATSPFALLGNANTENKMECENISSFNRLLAKLKVMSLQNNSAGKLNLAVASNAQSQDDLLLTAAQLAAINPQAFSGNGAVKYISDPTLAGQLTGIQNKLQQIVQKLNLQQTDASGNMLPIDLSKIDLSALSLDEFQLVKKLAFADIAAFISQPKVKAVDANTVVQEPQGPSFLDDSSSDLSALLNAPQMIAALQMLQHLQVRMPTQGDDVPVLCIETASLTPNLQRVAAIQNAKTEQGEVLSQPLLLQTANNAMQQGAAIIGQSLPSTGVGTAKADTVTPTLQQKVSDNTAPIQAFADVGHYKSQVAFNGLLLAAKQEGVTHAGTHQTVLATLVAGAKQDVQGAAASALTDFDANGIGYGVTAMLTSGADASVAGTQGARPAGAAHPATELMQAAIQRLANNKNTTAGEQSIVIQLDPPSMGRVRVTLNFGQDKTVNAKIIAEKPETLALLQKESTMLERGLQNAGLSLSDDAGMSFDLSQQGFGGMLNHNGGSNNPYGSNDNKGQNGDTPGDGSEDALELGEILTIEIDTGRLNIRV